jgi:hypothetical protein
MAKQHETTTTKEQTFTIHTVTGEKMTVRAVSVKVDPKQNRVYFLDADGKDKDEGIYVLSGIVAIKPSTGGGLAMGRLRM